MALISGYIEASDNSSKCIYRVSQLGFKNETYKKILDRVLYLDKDCYYFTSSLGYSLQLANQQDTLYIILEGDPQHGILLGIRKVLGVLRYNKHDFIVYGDSLPEFLRNKKSKVNLIEPDGNNIMEDDSHSIHYFCVYNYNCYYLKSIRRGLKKK